MKKSFKSLITMLLVVSLLMSNIAMIATYAVMQDYPVELAFNNIFVFDKWAGNKLSTTIVNNGTPVDDELEINIENGSFRFNNQYSTESYTGHGMGTGGNAAGNVQYYNMEVESDTFYTFSYYVTFNSSSFTPYVFFFDENNEFLSFVPQPVYASGDTSFVFITPHNAKYIQLRFTIPNAGYAEVKDILIRKSEVVYSGTELFDFSSWESNSNNNKVSDFYPGGSVTTNSSDKSVTLTTDGTTGDFITNFSLEKSDGFYTMPVSRNTTYKLVYNLSDCNFAPNSYMPYVVFYGADGAFILYINSSATSKGLNNYVFTTPENATSMSLVYGITGINNKSGMKCTVKDVSIQKISINSENANYPHRQVYTYSASTPATYGTLPVPSYAPQGYVFAGWYTGKDGTGTHITENTAVNYSSHTVYPKYEPKVDSLSVAKMPVKTSYTVGERVNPTGLVLNATLGGATRTIDSGYYCTPEYLTATGTQTVTAHYGGRTATFTVNVSASASRSVVINGSTVNASVTNNVYTLNYTASAAFNRYEMTYYSDAYVKGVMTYTDGTIEEFFLEPSSNFESGNDEFASYIDGYLNKILEGDNKTKEVTSTTRNGIKSIAFELLDNKSGSFELLSFKTSKTEGMPVSMTDEDIITANTMKLFENDKYIVGIDILNGGVVNYIEVRDSNIVARVYEENGEKITRVDYRDKLDATYGTKYIGEENTKVNLINYYDNGRFLQQSYYGTGEKPYEQGYYNSADWNYNPVQGGNVIAEASKVIDYEIGADYIYVKTRPLDWAKWSDDFANLSSSDDYDPIYGEDYVTDTYVEARYVFADGMIKVYNRMVDYSGLPTAQTTQELPAFYTIEPLNHYVYNDVSNDDAWKTKNLKYDKEPEFWGITQDYISNIYPEGFNANRNTPEHWAAFMASDAQDSFGIGLYSPEVTNFFYGIYPPIYDGESKENTNYRHAETNNPAREDDSSYIAPVEVRTFESFKPTEYSYYISTGTVDQIRNSFGVVDDEGFAAELNSGSIAVPETIYMTPSTGESKTGQYYVNNILDKETKAVTPEAKNNNTNAYVQFYIPGAKDVTIAVNTITSGIGDIVLNEAGNIQTGNLSLSYEGMSLGSVIDGDGYFNYPSAGLYINGTGLKAGQTALAEWVFTITMDDGSVRTYYAYSTLYAPYIVPVGSAVRVKANATGSWFSDTSVFAQTISWISGVHSINASSDGMQPNNILSSQGKGMLGFLGANNSAYVGSTAISGVKGTAGDMYAVFASTNASTSYFYAGQSGSSLDNPGCTDWFNGSSTFGIKSFDYYNTEGNPGSNYRSGLLYSKASGNITIDTSRYSNLNQIPNLGVGFLVTDNERGNTASWYVSDFSDTYTHGKVTDYFQSKKEDSTRYFTEHGAILGGQYNSDSDYDSSLSGSYTGAGLKYAGSWNRALKSGDSATYAVKTFFGSKNNGSTHALAFSFTDLNATQVSKGELRNLVLKASSLNKSNYTAATWNEFQTALRTAAEALGNPTNSDIATATSNLKSKTDALQTTVKLDANGGSIGTTSFNVTVGSELSFDYDVSSYVATNGPTGYHFAGWSADKNATEGSITTVKAGLMPTFYAVWSENSYTVSFIANGGSGFVADKTVKYKESFTLPSYEFTRIGYKLLGWSKSASATTAEYTTEQNVSSLATSGTVTLYAVWQEFSVNVAFENMFDFSNFKINTAHLTINSRTETGFTVTSSGTSNDANTEFSDYIAVEPGKTYILSAEIGIECVAGDVKGYDMYIHTLDANRVGETTATVDTSNGAHREGNVYISLTGQKIGASVPYIRFTAGENTAYVRIRFDANTPDNKLTVNNIRLYEDNGVSVAPANKLVPYGDVLGTLPTPKKNGYDFAGWYDVNGTQYTSSSIMNSTSTLYLNSRWTLNSTALVSDAYVLDFGMKAVFTPLDNDTVLKNDGASYSISGVSTDGKTAVSTVNGAYGTFTVVDAETVEYVPTTTMNGSDVAYYHVNVGGKVLVGTMIVFPANVVYYEDNVKDAIDYTDGVATSGNTGKWATTGTSKLDSATQNLSDKVYGYDNAYNNTDNFSMNSAHVVSVSKYNNPQGRYNGVADNAASWPVAEFTFAGTGFDIVSLISKNTGAIEVKVFSNTDTTAKPVYDWIVDTYYGYTIENGEWVVNPNADISVYQIPVISNNSLAYGTYTVQVIPTYTSRLDHQNDGAYDFYLDAIRVYNPMGDDIDAATIYLNNGEYVVAHQAIRDILVDAGSFNANGGNTAVYINPGVTAGTFEQYSKAGPKNEVYLAKGQSVAFNMTVSGFKPSSVQISAHAVDGTAEMRIASGSSYANTISISHKTTLYYSAPFTAAEYWVDNGNGTYSLKSPIVITNNGDGILSLCNIKVTSDASTANEPMMFMMNDEDFDTAVYSVSRVASLTADDGALFVPEELSPETDKDVAEKGEDVLVTINTSAEVYALTVNGENATLVSVNDDGSKIWNYTFVTETRGEMTFTLVAYDAYGFASEETTVTVDVQSKIEIFFNKISNFFKMIIEFIDKLF